MIQFHDNDSDNNANQPCLRIAGQSGVKAGGLLRLWFGNMQIINTPTAQGGGKGGRCSMLGALFDIGVQISNWIRLPLSVFGNRSLSSAFNLCYAITNLKENIVFYGKIFNSNFRKYVFVIFYSIPFGTLNWFLLCAIICNSIKHFLTFKSIANGVLNCFIPIFEAFHLY